VTEATYPRFPVRGYAIAGLVALALAAGAIVVNESGPDVRRCAVAAEHAMAAHDYSVGAMRADGPGRLPACHGLSAGQYGQAVLDGYELEYRGILPRSPVPRDLPPPAYKARSARDAAGTAGAAGAAGTAGAASTAGTAGAAQAVDP